MLDAKCGLVHTAMDWILVTRFRAVQCDLTLPSLGGAESGSIDRKTGRN